MGERRKSVRHKSLLHGRVVFDHGRSAVDCLVRDLSEAGARLLLSEAVAVPEVVELCIPQKGQSLTARVQWRRGDETGVAFSLHAAPTSAEIGDRVEKLEAEIAAMRRLVNRLKAEVASLGEQNAV